MVTKGPWSEGAAGLGEELLSCLLLPQLLVLALFPSLASDLQAPT